MFLRKIRHLLLPAQCHDRLTVGAVKKNIVLRTHAIWKRFALRLGTPSSAAALQWVGPSIKVCRWWARILYWSDFEGNCSISPSHAERYLAVGSGGSEHCSLHGGGRQRPRADKVSSKCSNYYGSSSVCTVPLASAAAPGTAEEAVLNVHGMVGQNRRIRSKRIRSCSIKEEIRRGGCSRTFRLCQDAILGWNAALTACVDASQWHKVNGCGLSDAHEHLPWLSQQCRKFGQYANWKHRQVVRPQPPELVQPLINQFAFAV